MPNPIQDYIEELFASGKLQDGFVLSQEQRNLVNETFVEGQIKLKKNQELPNSVIRDKNGQCFALLGTPKGMEQSTQGVIKVAQNLTTGEFCLVKITRIKKLQKELYKKEEAEREAAVLKKYPRLFIGDQSRENPSEKYEYKHYRFINILPGIHAKNGELFSGSPIKQCELALAFLNQLEELKQNRLVHRDLHDENILINPKTMEVNFIDFGMCVPVDNDGFWYGPDTSDVNGRGSEIKFANGADVYTLCNSLPPFGDKKVMSLFKALYENAVARRDELDNPLEYSVVDLQPTIKAITEYLHSLTNSPGSYCALM